MTAPAQELYDGAGKKILTYPRAEVRYLPESAIGDVLKSRISSSRLHAIGQGRVKTPTLAIACKRELEIRDFSTSPIALSGKYRTSARG